METIYWLPQYALTEDPENSSTARTKLGSSNLLLMLMLPFPWTPMWMNKSVRGARL